MKQEQPGDDPKDTPQKEAEAAKGKAGEPRGLVEEEDGDDDEEEEEEDEDEQQLLGEFEKELEGMLLPSDRERLRSEVKAGMERELENIIQEVRNPVCGATARGTRDRGSQHGDWPLCGATMHGTWDRGSQPAATRGTGAPSLPPRMRRTGALSSGGCSLS